VTEAAEPVARKVGARPVRTRKALLIDIARYVAVVIVVLAAIYALWSNWSAVSRTLTSIPIERALLSAVAVLGGILAATMSWQVLVDDFGAPIGVGRGAQIFLVGQLGKYIPGSVWAYLLQIELGNKAGLSRARVFAATFFSICVAMVAALLAGALALNELISENPALQPLYWAYLILPVALVLLYPKILTRIVLFAFKILRRPRPDHPVRLVTVATALAWALGSYLLYGLHLWLLVAPSGMPPANALALCIGTMAIALISGLFVFFLPSGIGVRELIIVTGVSVIAGVGPAVAYATLSRALFTVADLVSAGAAALVGVLARRKLGRYQGESGTP